MFHELDDPTPPLLGDGLRAKVRAGVRTRRRRRRAVGGAAGVAVLGLGVASMYGRAVDPLRQVQTLELGGTSDAPVLPGAPTTVLVLGTDGDGAGIDGRSPHAYVDSALLLRTDPGNGRSRLLSVPRDLQVGTTGGGSARLAELYATEGVDGVVRVIRDELGVAVDHVVVVDFGGFVDAVEAVGGIRVGVTAPLRDEMSGLDLESPGCVRLDGPQALALVRSRHLERFEDGAWIPEPSGDTGRMQRQRALADALRAQVGVPDPLTLRDLTAAVADDLTVDSGLDIETMVSILHDTLAGELTSLALPTQTVQAADSSMRSVPTADATAVLQWFSTGTSDSSGPDAPPSTAVTDESLAAPDAAITPCQ